ncbi:hypothetical protein JKF63_03121 [Porcisia hertigi]|uniref:Uncharacterized protein n=1 Tax=Porcisia hertigi TaxID=2761500 RepID=A0A836L6E8_9TRYP|nr:hypothetical protein JKF63_03121 [Porcisia hertigi]
MAKKEKKPVAALVTSPGCTEECLLEVFLRRDLCAQLVPELLILLRLNNQTHFVLPHQILAEANSHSVGDGQQSPDSQLPAVAPLLHLVKQSIPVGESTTRYTILNDSSANRIDVYSLLNPSDEGDPGGKQAGGSSTKQRKNVTAPGAKPKGKAAAGLTALPDGAHHVGGAELSLIPLLRNSKMDVAVLLAAGSRLNLGDSLHFRVQCCDSLLFPAQCMAQCRPVLVRVCGVAGLPTLASTSGSPITENLTAPTSADSRRRLRTCISLAGKRVTVDAQPIKPSISDDDDAAITSISPKIPASTFHDYVFFLDELGTPLDVYRQLYSAPCEVSLWQSFEMDAERTASAAKPAPTPPGNSTEALIGSGSFSVRDFLTDDQTRFSETVQLLPSRSTVGVGGEYTCLTTDCSVSVHLDFFQPFTPLLHVDKDGQALPHTAFLTRALLRLPYAAPWTRDFLAFLLREVTALPRATQDVQYHLPPVPPVSPPPPAKAIEKEKPVGRRSGAPHSRCAAPPAPSGSSKKQSSSGGNHKSGKISGRTPPPDPTPDQPTPSFADALKVYSPPGLSGFEVTDGQVRLWCFEATVPEVQRLLSQLGRFLEARRGVSTEVSILFNAELFAPQRMYMKYPPLIIPPAGMTATLSQPGEVDGASVALEVEPSGTGGRLHRIRLCSPIGALCRKESHYVRRNLSDDCLQSLQSLAALLGTASMREAEMRGWMPSATLLVSTERSFGKTLEEEDLYGVAVTTFPESKTATAASYLVNDAAESAPESNPGSAAAFLMGEATVGSLISFDGMLKTEGLSRIPAAARLRFSVLAWMVVTNTKEEVLCAFPHSTPTGLVQYHIEGQVVRCSTTTLLYVLNCTCLARSVTHSHNAAFERVLRQRQRDEHTLLKEKMARSAGGKLMPVRQAAGGVAEGSGDVSRSHADKSCAPAAVRARRASSSDESEDGEVDWLDSSVEKYLCTSLIPPVKPPAPPRRLQRDSANARWLLAHKTQRKQAADTVSSPAELTFDELWRMYDRRAPTSATATSAPNDKKLPLMRF